MGGNFPGRDFPGGNFPRTLVVCLFYSAFINTKKAVYLKKQSFGSKHLKINFLDKRPSLPSKFILIIRVSKTLVSCT